MHCRPRRAEGRGPKRQTSANAAVRAGILFFFCGPVKVQGFSKPTRPSPLCVFSDVSSFETFLKNILRDILEVLTHLPSQTCLRYVETAVPVVPHHLRSPRRSAVNRSPRLPRRFCPRWQRYCWAGTKQSLPRPTTPWRTPRLEGMGRRPKPESGRLSVCSKDGWELGHLRPCCVFDDLAFLER